MKTLPLLEWIARLLIVFGLAFACYYGYQFFKESSQVEDAPEEARSLAPDWNDTSLKPALTHADPPMRNDPNAQKKKPALCAPTGYLYIPRIGKKMPYVFGTTDTCLKKGLGLFMEVKDLVYVGEMGRCIISGHRDTHFRDARKIIKGDRFIVTSIMKPQKIFIYQYTNRRIVDKNDTTVAVPSDKPELCLTTCYPFGYVGSAPKRYVMCGPLVDVKTVPQKEWERFTLPNH